MNRRAGLAARLWVPLLTLSAALLASTLLMPAGQALWALRLSIDGRVEMATAPPPAEGCSPGFWRQARHLELWPAPYAPGDSFAAVFLGEATPAEPTLLQALEAPGGGLAALRRQATAALLNAASPAVDYLYSVEDVIGWTRQAILSGEYEPLKDLFEAANEAACPLPPDEQLSSAGAPSATPAALAVEAESPTPEAPPDDTPTLTPTPAEAASPDPDEPPADTPTATTTPADFLIIEGPPPKATPTG